MILERLAATRRWEETQVLVSGAFLARVERNNRLSGGVFPHVLSVLLGEFMYSLYIQLYLGSRQDSMACMSRS